MKKCIEDFSSRKVDSASPCKSQNHLVPHPDQSQSFHNVSLDISWGLELELGTFAPYLVRNWAQSSEKAAF